MRSKRRGKWAVVLAAGWLTVGEVLAQCAMCGTALSSQEDPLTRGILWSALFLVAMPFALFGSISGWLYLAYRRAHPREARARLLSFRNPPSGKEHGVKEVER